MTTPISEPITIFGGYVEELTANAGYGGDSSSCQFSLVFESDGPLRATDMDNNFPELGTAVGLKINNFEFCGILQRWTHKRSISGYKYDVIIESPSKWLDGLHVIISGFQGTTFPSVTHVHPQDNITLNANKISTSSNYIFANEINNIWNPFAVLENYQYGGSFGGADVNSAGFPAKRLLEIIEEISRGEHPFGGKAVFGESQYEVDLSELIAVVPEFFRVKGPTQNLNAIIQECCEVAACDYIISVYSKSGFAENGVIDDPVIKVRIIDKSLPPNPETIKTIVSQYESQAKLISGDFGKEFLDTTTQKIVIGGPASRHYTGAPYNFYPIWGKTMGIRPQYIIGTQTVNAGGLSNNAIVPISLNTGALYNATVLEIRCAISSFDTWVLYKALTGASDLSKYTKIRVDDYAINGIISGEITIQQLFNTKEELDEAYGGYYDGLNPLEEITKIYNSIKSVGDQYYGKKFLVPLPFEIGGIDNNIRFINEDQQYETSWKIADSAWVDNKPFLDVSFYDSEGKLKPVASWVIDPTNDYSGLNNNYAFGMAGLGSIISVEPEIYWLTIGLSPIAPYCVVEVPEVLKFDEYTTDKLALVHLLKLLKNITISPESILDFGSESALNIGIAPAKTTPMFISIPQESSRYTWGPWWKYSSKKGKAEVVYEESLRPETFGSSSTLNSIGYDYAFVASANVAGNEAGYIEVAELPIHNLADRFAVSGPYVSNIECSVSLDGVKTTYKFNTWTPQFGRLQKYNADRLSRINKGRIQFLQDQRDKYFKTPFPPKVMVPLRTNSYYMPNMGAFNLISASLLNGKANVQGQAVGNAMVNFAAPQKRQQGFACSQEQIFTPVRIEKPNGNNPSTLNPYFAFADNDFAHVVCEGGDGLDFQENKANITAVRTLALRGPILLSGWGFDLYGNPVPAKDDDPAEFADDAPTNRNKWKTGPIDLRWDEERKVWSSGFDVREGILVSDIVAPTDPDNPTTFQIQTKKNNWEDGDIIDVTNRDKTFSFTLTPALEGLVYVGVIKANNKWTTFWINCET